MVNGDPAQLALAGGELLRRVGVTTGSDISMVTTGPAFEAFKATVSKNDFPARVTYSPKITDMTRRMSEDDVFSIVSKLKSESNERFTFGPLKWVSDGSIQGFTGKLNWPGYCGGDDHGQLLLDEAALIKQLTPYHNAGFQIAVHANGDEAIDTVIGAFEKILNSSPRYDHRHRLEHFQMASPAAIKKMAALNLCANIFSNHIYYWGDTHRSKTMGPDKARRMDAAASAIEAGIQISIHSDHPVTPVNPLFTMWCAVNRVTRSGFVLGPAERITPLQALTAMTLGSAYLMNRDDMLGSLEVGKWADFTVLTENPLSVDPMSIKDIEVVGTVIGGKPTGK
jgi:predicted amidohydrolase YtcJ